MPVTSSLGLGGIKQIIRGQATITWSSAVINVTIPSVVTARSVVFHLGSSLRSGATPAFSQSSPAARIELTSSTNLLIETTADPNNGYNTVVGYQIVEYF